MKIPLESLGPDAPRAAPTDDDGGVNDRDPDRPELPRRAAGSRRSFLAWGAVAAAGATGAAFALARGRSGGGSAASVDPSITLPAPSSTPTSMPGAIDASLDGLTPLITPTAEFFRIDTAFNPAKVDLATWRLRIGGQVDAPFELSYDDLLNLPQVERPITLACVSNGVGGSLVGTAMWQGVPLRSLLDRAGVRPTGTQVFSRSVDGFTSGFPIEALSDGRDALVVVGMNGDPLPAKHGFPARLVVEGLYGYVSATKWLSSIDVVPWDSANGYWIPLGWSKLGPVKTACRIDVPAPGNRVAAGRIAVAGVAWSATTGISAVEVRIDDGPWQRAELGASYGPSAWRQWVAHVDVAKGTHEVTARATDGRGIVQTADEAPPDPDGATGWPSRIFVVD